MTDKHYRFAGVLGLVAAIGSTAIHRAIYEQAKHGPAQLGEFAAGLMTFVLACAGILLLIHGARLFKQPQRVSGAKRDGKLAPAPVRIDPSPLDSRHDIGSFLAARAIASAAARAAMPAAWSSGHPGPQGSAAQRHTVGPPGAKD
jgi:hypothetical protein